MNRTIYIGNPAYLKCEHRQMKVIDPDSKQEKGSVPIEDIAFVVLDHQRITLTHHLMQRLMEARAVILSCDASHLPHSLQLPLSGHTLHTKRLHEQIGMSAALRKRLWAQTVEAKIHNQARLLEQLSADAAPLWELMREVRTGDSTNREGVAAKYYWGVLFRGFIRDRDGDSPNHLLNFGYAILRSVVARALSSAGFHLALGIHHHNQYDATCLANDLMEPYRPYVDELVYELVADDPDTALTLDTKRQMLSMMSQDVRIDGKTRPLQIATAITAASLHRCIKGDFRLLRYPMR